MCARISEVGDQRSMEPHRRFVILLSSRGQKISKEKVSKKKMFSYCILRTCFDQALFWECSQALPLSTDCSLYYLMISQNPLVCVFCTSCIMEKKASHHPRMEKVSGTFTTHARILFYNTWKQNCGKLQIHCSEFHQ